MAAIDFDPARAEREFTFFPVLVILSSLAMMVVGTGSVYMLVVMLKPISLEFGWDRSVPSIAYALQYLGGGIGGVLMGHWLDRSGMGNPALLGAVMIGSGAILTQYIDHYAQLWAIYGLMIGMFGRATLFSPLMTNITRWFNRRRGFAVGIVGSGQALSGGLWPPIFQYGIDTYGWRDCSAAYGALVLCVMVPLSFVFRRRPPQQPPHSPRRATRRAANDRTGRARRQVTERGFIVLLCIAIVGCCVAMSLPLAHLVAHVSDIGYEAARGAEMLSIALLTAALSSMIGVGALSQRFGGLGGLFIFSWTQMFALMLLCTLDGLPALYVTAFVFGLGYGGILPTYPVIVREYLPAASAGRRTAIVVLFGSVGMAIGSWVGGLSVDLSGSYFPAFALGVAFNVFNLVLVAYIGGLGDISAPAESAPAREASA